MTQDSPSADSSSPQNAADQFEVAYGKLQQVVGQLEQGNLTLAQSLQAYEQGVGWLKTCYQGLQEVEQQIRILTKVDADGQVHWEAFDATASATQVDGAAPRVTTAGRGEKSAAESVGATPARRKKSAPSAAEPNGDIPDQPRLF